MLKKFNSLTPSIMNETPDLNKDISSPEEEAAFRELEQRLEKQGLACVERSRTKSVISDQEQTKEV
jgi:hypothetical protein